MKRLLLVLAASGVLAQCAWAGNDTKRGQAGASELLINPWARSSGWGGANAGNIRGVESMMLNVGGLAYVRRTDLIASYSRWMAGSGISINTIGFGQRLSSTGVLGVTLMNVNLGDAIETTYEQPEGTGRTFSPSLFNLGLAYSQKFSDRITAGLVLRTIYQSISNASALGVAFDLGIQYQTGKDNRFKFGVALRNVGPKMVYGGEGLSFKGTRDAIGLTVSNRTAPFELPALLNIGASYDVLKTDQVRLTPAFTFTSNSYTRDQLQPGLEIGFLRDMFQVRSGYTLYQDFLKSESAATDVNTGFSAGATFQLMVGKGKVEATDVETTAGNSGAVKSGEGKSILGIDFSYRSTNLWGGTYTVGLVYTL